MVKIENRGKNLFNGQLYVGNSASSKTYIKSGGENRLWKENGVYYFQYSNDYRQTYFIVPVQAGKSYTLSFTEINPAGKLITGWTVYPDLASATDLNNALENKSFVDANPRTFTATVSGICLINIGVKYDYRDDGGLLVFKNIQLEEGSEATEYEPPRNDYIEFDTELFGYNGIYDKLHDDGTLIKRWQRVTGISITNGSGSLSGNPLGIGTCILINELDGLPYEGTVSGTSISTSAPDGTYTVIYQLATPEIINLNYDGELILHPGENNLILPDFAVAAISGARKYLEG